MRSYFHGLRNQSRCWLPKYIKIHSVWKCSAKYNSRPQYPFSYLGVFLSRCMQDLTSLTENCCTYTTRKLPYLRTYNVCMQHNSYYMALWQGSMHIFAAVYFDVFVFYFGLFSKRKCYIIIGFTFSVSFWWRYWLLIRLVVKVKAAFINLGLII